jgi:PAS domain S-box-containing protein
MQILISLLNGTQPDMIFPNQLFGWLGWLLMAGLIGWGVWQTRENLEPLRERWWLAILLLAAGLLTAIFLGVRLPGEVMPMPGMPMERQSPALMFFASLPWVLAAGMIGPLPAVGLGLVQGLMLGLFDTISPFTMLEIGLVALLFSMAVRQNYRTRLFRFLRHPLGAALLVALAYVPIIMLSALFATNDILAVRLDYAFTQTWLSMLSRGTELILAGLFAEIIFLARPDWWVRSLPLQPSPAESNIEVRFYTWTVPMVALLVLSLFFGDWLVAGNAARQMIRTQLSSTAQVAAESLPYFLETGQNLILTLATPELLDLPPEGRMDALTGRMRSVPYFRQLFLFDAAGNPLAGHPVTDFQQLNPTEEETSGIKLALKGVTTQVYVVPPSLGETSAQISFLAAIRDSAGEVRGVMLGRADLNTNPFTQPVIKALEGMRKQGGEGIILDEKGVILYHPVTTEVTKRYTGKRPAEASFFEEPSPDNTRQFVYYQPVQGRPWTIVLTVPVRVAQQMALNIAIPFLVLLLCIALVAFISLRLFLRAMTKSLHLLAHEADYIAREQLDRPLKLKGVDEVGRLGAAFEQMRVSLKARLEELNSLLRVSQGVAANLDISEAARPILEAALIEGAGAARLVLVRDVTQETNAHGPIAFGVGPEASLYSFLDHQLFDLARVQDIVNLPNVSRTRRLQISSGAPHPGALLALPVRHENSYYGVLWVAFEHPRNFSDEEIRFLTTLASEASLAGTSARLYSTAEVGRQRLEAVLASTPEPVLVIDEQSRLLLLNPAAIQVTGLVLTSTPGSPVSEVVNHPDLLSMLTMILAERISSHEISLSNGKVYYASVSPVVAEGHSVGRVCILRDITHFKELEQLKSEFVATVSHDLRSPLTLMRGYATMLQMVGDLNEQQKGYVKKIVTGIENMTRLVNNLLDLGRIEAGIGLQIEQVPLAEIADEVINSLQLQAVQKDIRLAQEIVTPNRGLVVEADKALIQQAMYNLVENAIKYTGVGGQIKIRLADRAGVVLVEIHDNGIGIAPLDLPHLFEKFYRSGRREAYSQRGTGLGLAIVKSIAERHGGRVWVDSQLGKGSVFSMEVPCEQPQRRGEEKVRIP